MVDRDDYEDTRPTGMTAREEERHAEARREGDKYPDVRDPSGDRTVSERIERESVVGGHGHGGALDEEIKEFIKEND